MKQRTGLITTLLAGLGLAGSVHADRIDDIVLAEQQRQHIPGLGVAVVKDGRVVKEAGYGTANVEHDAKATAATFFQTASVGKQFTATLVLLLVEDGKLRLDEPVSTYLPGSPAAWEKITVRHLLSHTSGLDGIDKAIDLRKDYSEDELLASAAKVPLRFAPGAEWSYSNLGYQVLGILCSKAGGKFYGEQLRERLFEPSGMDARIISERDIVPQRAAGYDRIDGKLLNQEWVAPSLNTTADGSLYVSARDMARWSLQLDGGSVLTPSIKQALWTPARLDTGKSADYGFGWEVFNTDGRRSVKHRGDWQGFTSYILHYPEDRLTITVLTNRSHTEPDAIAEQIAAQVIPALAKPPATASPAPSAATQRAPSPEARMKVEPPLRQTVAG